MAKQIETDYDFVSASRILNLLDPSVAQEAATKNYVDNAIDGLDFKEAARVASVSNVNVSSAPASIDGITLSANDRVLLKDQTLPEENGIYIFSAATSPLVRSSDGDTFAELEQAVISVKEGTSEDLSYRQTEINGTIDVSAVQWITFGTSVPNATETTPGKTEIATQAETDTGTDDFRYITPLKLANWSGRIRKTTALIGDGASTVYTVTHNFGTRAVKVEVYRNSGNYDTVETDVERPNTNDVTIGFSSAPAANEFEVVVIG